MWIIIYFMAIHYLGIRSMSPLSAGVWGLPPTAMMAPAALVVGLIVLKTGHYRTFHLGGWIIIIAVFSILHFFGNTMSDWHIVGTGLAAGIGFAGLLSSMWPGAQATVKKEDDSSALCMAWLASSAGQTLGLVIGSGIFVSKVGRVLQEQDFSRGAAEGLLPFLRGNGSLQEMSSPQHEIIVQAIVDALQAIWIVAAGLAVLALILSLIAMCPCLKDGAGSESEEETMVNSSDITETLDSTDFWIHHSDSFLREEGSETGTLVGSYLGCFEYPEVWGDPSVPPTIRLVTDRESNS